MCVTLQIEFGLLKWESSPLFVSWSVTMLSFPFMTLSRQVRMFGLTELIEATDEHSYRPEFWECTHLWTNISQIFVMSIPALGMLCFDPNVCKVLWKMVPKTLPERIRHEIFQLAYTHIAVNLFIHLLFKSFSLQASKGVFLKLVSLFNWLMFPCNTHKSVRFNNTGRRLLV